MYNTINIIQIKLSQKLQYSERMTKHKCTLTLNLCPARLYTISTYCTEVCNIHVLKSLFCSTYPPGFCLRNACKWIRKLLHYTTLKLHLLHTHAAAEMYKLKSVVQLRVGSCSPRCRPGCLLKSRGLLNRNVPLLECLSHGVEALL